MNREEFEEFIAASPEVAGPLGPAGVDRLRRDTRQLHNDAAMLSAGLAEIRAGRWDAFDPDAGPSEQYPERAGAVQRSHMEDVLYAADQMIPAAEAVRAWALHGLRTLHGATHAEIAARLGVPRSTASTRWQALERRRPDRWTWARGTDRALAAGVCDNASVGVLIFDGQGRLLLIERGRWPWGWAPVAGHVYDEHDSTEAAAYAEADEEVGLHLEHLEEVAGGWRTNRCRRPVAEGAPVGHQWTLYRATATGEPHTTAEARSVRWAPPAELQSLADRTAAHARGDLTAEEFAAAPGLEPVWVYWLNVLGLITVVADDLDSIETLTETPPTDPEEH